jgi:cytohesin
VKTKNEIIALWLAFASTILISQFSWSQQPPLVEAAEVGNMQLVESLVSSNADVNAHGVWGRTALHFAANRGDAKMVEFLLKHKADPNARDEQGLTPIIQSFKSLEVIKLLLAYGADINAHGYDNTLYSQAIENPRDVGAGVVEFILTNGVDVTVSGEEGIFQTVLFGTDTNLVKMLVPLYINSTNPAAMRTLRGVFEETLARDSEKMASAIISVFIQFQTNSLQKAVVIGDDDVANQILATNPAAANYKDFFGWTPLHLAALIGKAKIAKTLIANQADVNAQDDIANSPLHWAAFYGREDLVKLLLEHKANIDLEGNTQGNNQYISDTSDIATPLDFAIRNGFTEIATMLITNGANLGSHTWWNDTPLHIATSKENVELMKLLLSHGANINAGRAANYKQSPLDIAVCGNSPEAVRLLIASGASLQTRMQTHNGGSTTLFHLWAESGGNTNIANQLLAAGCNLNATNGDGQTPLHIAAGKIEAATWLLNHQANVNAKDKNGQTPLHLVITSGNTNVIQLLLAYKADANATDNKGKTALAIFEDL